jgi:hypothetical protein
VLGGGGQLCSLGRQSLPVPSGSSWFPSSLVWYRMKRHHLLIGQRHRLLWRSHGRFRSENVGEVALSRDHIAFSLYAGPRARVPALYIAHLGGEERRIAAAEIPLGWTHAGRLVTQSIRGGVLRARSAEGWLERTVARHVSEQAFIASRGLFFFVAGRRLERFDGKAVRRLGTLAAYGFSARTSLTPLQDQLVLQDVKRMVVLGVDGSLLSTTALPAPVNDSDWHSSTFSGALAASRDGTIAFTAIRGDGFETVYLLRPGAKAASTVYRESVTFSVCERMAQLVWRGSWLLYSASEGYAAAINTVDPAESRDLSGFVQRLPGFRVGNFDAGW